MQKMLSLIDHTLLPTLEPTRMEIEKPAKYSLKKYNKSKSKSKNQKKIRKLKSRKNSKNSLKNKKIELMSTTEHFDSLATLTL